MMANPMKTHGWVVNYDDGGAPATLQNPYAGSLSNWDLFGFARYLCRVHASVPRVVDEINGQLAWNDGMFVYYGSDPLLPIEPFYPTCAEQGTPSSFVLTGCWLPMDFHTAHWGKTLVEFHRLTKDPRTLAIARAAGGALEQYQLADGRTLTWMPDRASGISAHVSGSPATNSFWPAGWAMSASLWAELAAMGQ
jgi:hypothetical protein